MHGQHPLLLDIVQRLSGLWKLSMDKATLARQCPFAMSRDSMDILQTTTQLISVFVFAI